MLWDVEAPDYDQPRAFMSARQAMEVALASETKAHEFFVQAIPHLADPEVKRLFQELRDEEVLHQSLVREAMRSLPARPGAGRGRLRGRAGRAVGDRPPQLSTTLHEESPSQPVNAAPDIGRAMW